MAVVSLGAAPCEPLAPVPVPQLTLPGVEATDLAAQLSLGHLPWAAYCETAEGVLQAPDAAPLTSA